MNTFFDDEDNGVIKLETQDAPDHDSEDDDTLEGEIVEGGDAAPGGEMRDLLEFLEFLRRHNGRNEDDDEDSKDNDDKDSDDEDEDEDEDEEQDEDEEDKDEDEEEDDKEGEAPLGRRVILRSEYKSNAAYCEAVVKSIKKLLAKNGIHAVPHAIRDGVKVFAFDRSTRGVDVDCHVLIEYSICNIRIEYRFNAENRPGRGPLIDYFCQDRSFPLRYGKIIYDHNDGERKIEHSFPFYSSFAEQNFARIWDALESTLKVYATEYDSVAAGKKLDSDQRKLASKLIGQLSLCLPKKKLRPENEETFERAKEALGGNLSSRNERLLKYIVEHN